MGGAQHEKIQVAFFSNYGLVMEEKAVKAFNEDSLYFELGTDYSIFAVFDANGQIALDENIRSAPIKIFAANAMDCLDKYGPEEGIRKAMHKTHCHIVESQDRGSRIKSVAASVIVLDKEHKAYTAFIGDCYLGFYIPSNGFSVEPWIHPAARRPVDSPLTYWPIDLGGRDFRYTPAELIEKLRIPGSEDIIWTAEEFFSILPISQHQLSPGSLGMLFSDGLLLATGHLLRHTHKYKQAVDFVRAYSQENNTLFHEQPLDDFIQELIEQNPNAPAHHITGTLQEIMENYPSDKSKDDITVLTFSIME